MQTQAFPTLPQGFKRFSVEQLLIDVAPVIGLRDGALHALLYMMRSTRPDDWVNPDKEPVFFGQQQTTAQQLGKSTRALFNIERKLEDLGLVERRVKANGQRSSHGRCGIVFTRLISIFPDLLAIAEQKQADDLLRKDLASQRSSFLRYAKQRIAELDDDISAVERIEEEIAAWPRADRLHSLPIERLESHIADVKRLCVTLDDLVNLQDDSTGEPEQNFRCHIQENNPIDSSVSCNVPVDKRSAGKPAHTGIDGSRPYGHDHCLEKECEAEAEARKPKSLNWLTPQMLFNMASPEMQVALSQEAGGRTELRPSDFFGAAHAMLASLGINRSAWNDAINTMGEQTTWLAILCLDANRDHPQTPVKNVGGALRAVTRKARDGKFYLDGTVIGLAERKRVRGL